VEGVSARSHQAVDRLILSVAQAQWRKVAMILSQVIAARGGRGDDAELEYVAQRVRTLVENGRLQAQGDLSKWRHSEVRLSR
jgi:hypothetical protein